MEREAGGVTSYAFVENQPVSFVDGRRLFTFLGLEAAYGVLNSGGTIGPGTAAFGLTRWSSGVRYIKVKVATCGLCCLEDIDFFLRLKVYIPKAGDTLERDFFGAAIKATAQRVQNISDHEAVHVEHGLAVGNALFPLVEGCCKGRCWAGKWTHYTCYNFLLAKMKGYDENITSWHVELGQDWHRIHLARPGGTHSSDIPVTEKMRQDLYAVQNGKIANWAKTDFCGDGAYY